MIYMPDKLILLLCCAFAALFGSFQPVIILSAFLLAVTLSALCGYFEGRRFALFCLPFLLLAAWRTEFLVLLPLLVYDCVLKKQPGWKFCGILPFLFHLNPTDYRPVLAAFLFCCVSFILCLRTQTAAKFRIKYRTFRDSARETALHLEQKNRELMEKQDYETHLATLNERNRIAREIHDNVGHLLSRSLLQIGALQIVNRETSVQEGLSTMKQTLSEAMDSIRSSVHDLHDESIDLRASLEQLVQTFAFCPAVLDYDTGDMSRNLKYCMVSVVKEALSNVMKHSNATKVLITVREHPALYQLIVQDNGTNPPDANPDTHGIGLQNMADRIEALGGTFRFTFENGFRLFLSIPKPSFPERKEQL